MWENAAGGADLFSANNSTTELSEAGTDTAIVSVGATKQCGPNLPLHLDTLVAQYYARAWGRVLGAYVLPTMPFNTSEEHASFKGTVSLSPATVMLMLEEIVEALRAQGFRKQVLTIGRGGSLWLGAFVKHINRRVEDIVLVDAHRGAGPVWEEALRQSGLADRGEVHGGALSSALALYLVWGPSRKVPTARRYPSSCKLMRTMLGGRGLLWTGVGQVRGRYDPATDEGLATAEAGRTLLEYFVKEQDQRLEEHLSEACRIKGI